jgi:uncharacterized protein (DUF362 family)
MAKTIERLEKKFIIRNRFFIKNASPRLPESKNNINMVFNGERALDEMLKSGKDVFSDFNSETSVLIKINLNSSNPYPASTSLEMLETLIKLLVDVKVKKICIGDCSGLSHLPTRKVMKQKKIYSLSKKYNIKIKVFDYGNWVNVPIGGIYFKNLILSQYIYKYDKIINLVNIKTHILAGFSFSTKLLVGFMHPYQRFELHKGHLVEKIAEMSLAVQPDISIIDARKIFIDGGPDTGTIAAADSIIINSNLLDADISAYNLLFNIKKQYGKNDLDQNPFSNNFFKHFLKVNNINK